MAAKLKEARRVEDLLTAHEVSYVVEVEPFSRTLFGTLRYGAAFYVIAGQAEYCRSQLVAAGFERGVLRDSASRDLRAPAREDA